MRAFVISLSYIRWLYWEGVHEFLTAWVNYHWFVYHFFSVPVLAGTFFAPWRRMQEGKTRAFDPQKIAERIIINTVLRVTGMLIRSVFLVGAIVGQCVLFCVGGILFLYFLFSPISIPASFLVGIMLFLV